MHKFWFSQSNTLHGLEGLPAKACHVSDGVCVQSIEHPGCVWDAKFLENGDIVTACSDGVARIWTVHSDRIADSLATESFSSQLAQYKLSRYDIHQLPVCAYDCVHFAILKSGPGR